MSPNKPTFATKLRPTAAILLCLLIPGELLPAQTQQTQPGPTTALPVRPAPLHLDQDQRMLHLLSRFTFGPTPDEIASLHNLTAETHATKSPDTWIDIWFEQQLHPDRLPVTPGDDTLNTRLAEFPALDLPIEQLMERFPNGAAIRQAANGKREIPYDPTLAAIYHRHIDLYEDKQAKKAEASKEAATAPKPEMAKPDTAMATSKPASMAGDGDMGTSGMANPSPASPMVAANAPASKPAKPAPAVDPNRPTYADLLTKTVLGLPPNERVNRILTMQPDEYEKLHSNLKAPQKIQLTQDLTPAQRELLLDYDNPTRTVVEELQSQRLLRDIYSSHQLQEVMTTFWLNHFNVYIHKNEETPYYLVSYERDVIRPHALGNFEDLLVATAKSPAMLLYLDNNTSNGPDSIAAEKQKKRIAAGKATKETPIGLNENYARELMELHTLGVNGGYTQKDVTEVAKVFTGWTVGKRNSPSAQAGTFTFDENRHEPGKKQVLGHKIKENGEKEGLQLLHILATSPATAHFISQELATQFVSDAPPKTLVDRMAQSFLKTDGDISSVLRVMVKSPEFWAPAAYQAKVKTPLEYVVSAARASGAEVTSTQPLINQLNQMGMPLYACIPPTGYPSKADAWVSTGALVTRMNFSLSLATNHYPGIKADWTKADQVTSPADAEQLLEGQLVPTGVSDKTRDAVLEQSQDPNLAQKSVPPSTTPNVAAATLPTSPAEQKAAAAKAAKIDRQNAQLAGLLLGSPEFQRR